MHKLDQHEIGQLLYHPPPQSRVALPPTHTDTLTPANQPIYSRWFVEKYPVSNGPMLKCTDLFSQQVFYPMERHFNTHTHTEIQRNGVPTSCQTFPCSLSPGLPPPTASFVPCSQIYSKRMRTLLIDRCIDRVDVVHVSPYSQPIY